jgi:uncharacterized membrane protein YheB (UPF0754 family)
MLNTLFTTKLVIVLIAALIGWITNFIAIRMLFRPRRKINIFGITTLQGLVPLRKDEIAHSVGETIASELIQHEDITAILQEPETMEKIRNSMVGEVDQMFAQLTQKLPLMAMFIQGDMAVQVKSVLIEQIEAQLPKLVTSFISAVEQRVDFADIVENRIKSLELDRLEDLIYRVAAKELRTIEILGGVLGALVGIVQASLF